MLQNYQIVKKKIFNNLYKIFIKLYFLFFPNIKYNQTNGYLTKLYFTNLCVSKFNHQ